MIGWLIGIGYGLGWLYTARHIAGRIAWEFSFRGRGPETDDVVAGILFGGMLALVWPLALPIALATEDGQSLHFLVRTPAAVRARQREQQLAEAEQRIHQLEREVGIR